LPDLKVITSGEINGMTLSINARLQVDVDDSIIQWNDNEADTLYVKLYLRAECSICQARPINDTPFLLNHEEGAVKDTEFLNGVNVREFNGTKLIE